MRAILEKNYLGIPDFSQKIHKNLFIQKIHDATLSAEQFNYYSEQDDLYLEEWAKIILSLLTRLKTHALAADEYFLNDVGFIENHLQNVKKMIDDGVFNPRRKRADFVRANPSEVIRDYLTHLSVSSRGASFAVAFASLLGCYEIYRQIGVYSKNYPFKDDHPYATWLAANYDEEFVLTGQCVRGLTERLTEFELNNDFLKNREPVLRAIDQSCACEWAFFEHVMCDNYMDKDYTHGI